MEALLTAIMLLIILISAVLFRILFLVTAIHKRIATITLKPDKAREAYEKYLSGNNRTD
jgi:membrane protein required for beta-lactamase induction